MKEGLYSNYFEEIHPSVLLQFVFYPFLNDKTLDYLFDNQAFVIFIL
jgi:hypothetical protein